MTRPLSSELATARAQTETEPAIAFFVPGRPRSTQTGSVITVNGRTFPLRRGTAWSTVCGLVARQHAPATLLAGPVRCRLVFLLPAPTARRRARPTTRPDVENLAKGLLDAWNGILWRDDSQVVELQLRKEYGEARGPGVLVHVEAL